MFTCMIRSKSWNIDASDISRAQTKAYEIESILEHSALDPEINGAIVKCKFTCMFLPMFVN